VLNKLGKALLNKQEGFCFYDGHCVTSWILKRSELFEKNVGLKSVLMEFGLDSDTLHSLNEHYGIFNYLKGIETIPYFFKYFAE
jgi:hypothetical protein